MKLLRCVLRIAYRLFGHTPGWAEALPRCNRLCTVYRPVVKTEVRRVGRITVVSIPSKRERCALKIVRICRVVVIVFVVFGF